jgi:hypothetical protein
MAFWVAAAFVGKQVASGILGYEGARAWARWTGATGDALDEHAEFLNDIRSIVNAGHDRVVQSEALVDYEVAQRELALYRADPTRRDSLAEARVKASEAMSGYGQFMQAPMASCWKLSAELYLAILQEEHKIQDGDASAEATVLQTHRDYMLGKWGTYADHFVSAFNMTVIQPHTSINDTDYPMYFPPTPLLMPGVIAIHIPTPEETMWSGVITSGNSAILPFKDKPLTSAAN